MQVLKSPPPDGEMPAVLVLAMKPQKLDEAVPALAPLVGEGTLIVSVLAGVEVASLAKRFPKHRGIVRVMPNTPVAIGKGVALLHADAETDVATRAEAEELARPLGLTEWIRRSKVVPAAASKKVAPTEASKKAVSAEAPREAAETIPAVAPAPVAVPDLTEVLWPLTTLHRRPEPPRKPGRRAIDVGGVITRALTAAGLMK